MHIIWFVTATNATSQSIKSNLNLILSQSIHSICYNMVSVCMCVPASMLNCCVVRSRGTCFLYLYLLDLKRSNQIKHTDLIKMRSLFSTCLMKFLWYHSIASLNLNVYLFYPAHTYWIDNIFEEKKTMPISDTTSWTNSFLTMI